MTRKLINLKNINLPKKIILYGGTAQAKLLRPIIKYYNSDVIAVFDDTNIEPPFKDVDLFCGWAELVKWSKSKDMSKIGFCVAIGNPNSRERIEISRKINALGCEIVSIIHPRAIISEDASIAIGVQILAGAVISPGANIGKYCIINQNAIVGVSSTLGDGVELGPAANICGEVVIKNHSWICASACVLPRLHIDDLSIIAAGAVVTSNVERKSIVAGVPAKLIKKIQ